MLSNLDFHENDIGLILLGHILSVNMLSMLIFRTGNQLMKTPRLKSNGRKTIRKHKESTLREKKLTGKRREWKVSFRSNMVTIVKLLQHIKLKNERIRGLKKTPFWLLFKAKLKNKLNYK